MVALSDVEPQTRPEPQPASFRRLDRGHERFIIGGTALVSMLLIWELSARTGLVDPLLISSPTAVARAGYTLFANGDIRNDLAVSAAEFLIGYGLAAAIGIPLGIATGWYRRLSYLLGPFIDTLNAVPRVTLLPLIVIWFGIGIWSKVVVVFLGAVIPIAISAHSGVKTNEARYLNVARSFGASELKILSSIILPGTVPFIFTGLKYGSGRALLGVVAGELYAATAGVGFMIGNAGNNLRTDVLFFGVLLFTVAGIASVAALDWFERQFETWRPKLGSAA
jgi:ABC-type nitrate/sulfonate/bicarbonate transport system permease component